ncbi:MAG TPA: DNA polymerase Y family protein [Puia sp.]|nr:DNA polymerase Y family protein [Puia sp.]
MAKRYVTIWFRHLKTDWITLRRPELSKFPFVLVLPVHGKMIITATNTHAEEDGIYTGMPLADARAIAPALKYLDDKPAPSGKLLGSIARWCIRYSPVVAPDLPDGIIIDATGCAHLWSGEEKYITVMHNRFAAMGYDTCMAMADTIGAAWAMAHYGNQKIIEPGKQKEALQHLPPVSLRIGEEAVELLLRLGIREVEGLWHLPRSSMSRRFGKQLLTRLDQAMGEAEEYIVPVQVPVEFEERLASPEPIITATGIRIALEKLLERLCERLRAAGKGLRTAVFACYRVDGKIEQVEIGTVRASHNPVHLFTLFELKLEAIEPALGIELFVLRAVKTEEALAVQEKIWRGTCTVTDQRFSELMDRIAGKIGLSNIHRYFPAEHHWPERSYREAAVIHEEIPLEWPEHMHRPLHILQRPLPVEVTAPVPDYPPMNFRYRNKLHKVKKADGPERIEKEWWIEEGEHRDYYAVEDEEGKRYWLFRSGHYTGDRRNQWFLHGFFA